MAETEKIVLTKKDRQAVFMRTWLLQANWNYERMQNVGWCYAMIPAMRKLYKDPEDQKAFLKRHLEFFNTHPYVAAPVWGVELSLEETKANGAPVDDAAIQGVKIGMMGPLAGVGDPIFWGTLRPVLGAFAASLALAGSILGPILFFVIWNAVRMAFLWYTQEFGYQAGASVAKDLGGGLLQKVTMGASVLGMFIMGVLIPRWTSIDMSSIVFATTDYGSVDSAYPAATELVNALNGVANGATITPDILSNGLNSFSSVAGSGYSVVQQMADQAGNAYTGAEQYRMVGTTTLQSVLDQLLPGLLPLGLTALCMWLLKKGVNPIVIIFALFGVGILGALLGIW